MSKHLTFLMVYMQSYFRPLNRFLLCGGLWIADCTKIFKVDFTKLQQQQRESIYIN